MVAAFIVAGVVGLSLAPLATGNSGSINSPLFCTLYSYNYNTSPDSSAYARSNTYSCSPGYSGQAEYEVYVGNNVNGWQSPAYYLCGQLTSLSASGQVVFNLYVSQYYYGSNTHCQWDSSTADIQGNYMQPNTLYTHYFSTVSSGVNLTAWTWSDACGALPPPPAYLGTSQGAACTAVAIAHDP